MCGNRDVFRGVLLCTLSIVKYSRDKITLFLGTMDLSDIDPRYRPITEEDAETVRGVLKSANPDSDVVILDFGECFRDELINSKNLGTSYTPYCMIRLFADKAEMIGDKLLYLDTDIMLKGDVGELYDINVDGYHLAGSRDFFGKFFFTPRYINSGVLLFNMKKMREDGIFPKTRRLCNDKKMLLSDQHAINKFARRKLILKRRFNEQHATKSDTLVRHFSMTIRFLPYLHTESIKPWQPELVRRRLHDTSFDDIFLSYDKIIKEKNNAKRQ